MSRVVVRMQALLDGSTTLLCLDEPAAVDGGNLVIVPAVAPGTPAALGPALYGALAGHPAVKRLLEAALQMAGKAPLFLDIDPGASVAEALAWEATAAAGPTWLALDAHRSVVRVARVASAPRNRRPLALPLRMVAVLSTAGIPIAAERDAKVLVDLVAARPGLLELDLLVGQKTVLDAVNARGLPNVRAQLLGGDGAALVKKLRELRPDLLHLQCHGSAEGTSHLSLASASDWTEGKTGDGSIVLEAGHFRDLLEKDPFLWLATLSACSGGAVPQSGGSLGRSLVEFGVPAVIAMREPVDVADATPFIAAFYAEVADALQRVVDELSDTIEWSELLAVPRARMLERHRAGRTLAEAAGDVHSWALPLLYLARPLFEIVRVRDGMTRAAVAKAWRELVLLEKALRDTTNPPVVAAQTMRQRIRELEDSLVEAQ